MIIICLFHSFTLLFLHILNVYRNFAARKVINLEGNTMDNVLNAEFLRDLSYIAEDENMMRKLSAYARRLLATKADEAQMSKEEFINRVKTAENGVTYTMQQGESLDDLLKRTVQ